jgi:hypothetical protein
MLAHSPHNHTPMAAIRATSAEFTEIIHEWTRMLTNKK